MIGTDSEESNVANTIDAITKAIQTAIPGATVNVTPGSGGHYSLHVKSEAFRGKNMVESHRLVYGAIASLMSGDQAPVHAIDSLKTDVG